MRSLAQVNLTQDVTSEIPLDSGVSGLILVNESLFSVQVSVAGINRWLPAWTADFFDFSNVPVTGGQASVIPRYYTTTTNPPSAIILPTAVYVGDTVSGTYPYPLTRLVSSNVTASSAYALLAPDNLAEFFADDTSFPGVLALLPAQIPPNSLPLDIMLAAKLNGGTDKVVLQSDVVNNALNLKMALVLNINAGTGFSLSGMQVLSGTGPQTGVAHSLGVTPRIAIPTPTNGAVAISAQNYSPTTIDIAVAGGITWKCLLVV